MELDDCRSPAKNWDEEFTCQVLPIAIVRYVFQVTFAMIENENHRNTCAKNLSIVTI